MFVAEYAASTEKTGTGADDFLATARKRFARVFSAESENRASAIEDLKFKNGDQWPAQIKQQRTTEKRPCLTINKMKTFVHQVTNDQRQNRPAINVSPVGDKADPETAKMLKGLIRQIERQSNADIAYDTAFDGAVSNGWGYWRILTDYESDNSFDQVVRIMRIRNPFRVYLDPDHQEPDGSDAQWGFITDLMTREEFKAQYPKADPCDWSDVGQGDEYKDWGSDTHVRVAEYFCFKSKKKKLLALNNGWIGYEDQLAPEVLAAVKAGEIGIVKERDVDAKYIVWHTITAKEVIEENDWPGKWIPIVKVIGDEVDVDGKVTLAGLIRDARDPQRMYNYWSTAETELIALAPKAPYIMEEGQVEGHEQRWKEANNKSYPYLLYKGTSVGGKPAPPPQRQIFAGPPTGVVNAKLGAAQDMMATTGIRFDSTLQERTYDESGKALRELKRVSDIGSFHYVDNLARSLKHTGRILIDLIPKVYDTKRVLTILREDGSEEQVTIDPQMTASSGEEKSPDGRVMALYNPKVGDFDVAVTIGPNYATKRQEASESMIGFIKALPNAAPLVADLVAKNMDWPGSDEFADRLAAALPPNVLNASIGKFPPEAQALIKSMQAQMQKMGEEHKQALAMLGDKEADRNVQREKINKDFEAKMTDIAVGMQETIIKVQADMQKQNEGVMEKIAADFQAKILKIAADAEAKRQQTESQERIAKLKPEPSNA